jgi:prophage regulatory protein
MFPKPPKEGANMPKKIYRLREVLGVTGLSRTVLYRLIKLGRFPAPLRLSERAVGWDSDGVEQWVESRPSTRAAA